MKKLMYVLTLALPLALGTTPALAQTGEHAHGAGGQSGCPMMSGAAHGGMMHGGMMQGGMMQGDHAQMMSSPLMRTGMLVGALPEMKDELGLTDAQQKRIAALKADFTATRQQRAAQLAPKRQELQGLAAAERADPARVRTLMKELAGAQADLHALAYETGTKMQETLTPAQKEKLAALDATALCRKAMGGSGAMMQHGMQEGTMPHGGMGADPSGSTADHAAHHGTGR